MKRVALLSLDLSLIAGATVLALLLRDNFEFSGQHLRAFAPYLLITLACAAVAFSISGISWSVWRGSALHDYIVIAASSVATVLAAVSISFLINRLQGVPRTVPVLGLMNVVFTLVAARVFVRLQHDRRVRPSQFAATAPASKQKIVVVLGTTRIAELYLRSVAEVARHSVRVAGIISRRQAKVGRSLYGHQVLGTLDEISLVLKELEVHGVILDEICVALPYFRLRPQERQQLTEIEMATAIRVNYIADAIVGSAADDGGNDSASADCENDTAFDISEVALSKLRDRPFWQAKRVLDVTLAAFLLFVFAPLIFFVGILAALDVGLPFVFWQQRPGVGGRSFRLYKVRTMAAAHDRSGRRRMDEQRLSAIGKFFRRSRLDELPQLYNILIGDMSFVGPRPLLPDDQPVGSVARTFVRPGLTGWAQVNGGRDVSSADKAALDVWYIQNATLTLDAKIFARTALMLLFGEQMNRNAIELAWRDLRASGVCKGIVEGSSLSGLKGVRAA